jgi:hypothetical protein
VPVLLPDRTKVGMSDYVLPAWFDPQAARGPFNASNTLASPFQVEHGGYVVQLDLTTGQVSYVFGAKVPQWLQKQKLATRKCRARTKQCQCKSQGQGHELPASPPCASSPVPTPMTSSLSEETKQAEPEPVLGPVADSMFEVKITACHECAAECAAEAECAAAAAVTAAAPVAAPAPVAPAEEVKE